MNPPLVFFPTYNIPTYFGHIFSWNQDFETDKSYPSYRKFLSSLPTKRNIIHLASEEHGVLLSQCVDDMSKVRLVKPDDNQYLIKWKLPCSHEFFDTVKGRLSDKPWKQQFDCPYCYVEAHATVVAFSCDHIAFALKSMDAQSSEYSIDKPCGECAALCEHIEPLEHTRHLVNRACDVNSYNLGRWHRAVYQNKCLLCVENEVPGVKSLLDSGCIVMETRLGQRSMKCGAHRHALRAKILNDILDQGLDVDCVDYHSSYWLDQFQV